MWHPWYIPIAILVFLILRSILRFIIPSDRTDHQPPSNLTYTAAMSEPDRPTSFGYKGTWLAVKGNDPQEIAAATGIRKLQPCNWAIGIESAYRDAVFVTPPIDGWVLLPGVAGSFPDADSNDGITEVKKLLNDLSIRFGEAQYFGTHRGVGYVSWLRSINGEIIRAYAHADGNTLIVEGQPTPIEQQYQLVNTLSEEPGYQEREDLTYACEEEVMTIAGAWSVNPSTLHERHDLPAGLGLLGMIP